MSQFNNNNGVLSTLSTNVRFDNIPNETFVTQEELQATIDKLGYVTPEMFGAKGDGVTNDADAFRAAFASHYSVHLGEKTYLLGNEFIDLHDKIRIELIGQSRASCLLGGYFLVNMNDDWTNAYNRQGYRFPLHCANVYFLRYNRTLRIYYHEHPTFITANQVLFENCFIWNYNRFLCLTNGTPNSQGIYGDDSDTSYFDRMNFLQCNFSPTSMLEHPEHEGVVVCGCSGRENYTDWLGAGDDWNFTNCSFGGIAGRRIMHVSSHNHSLTFYNCINPSVWYGHTSASASPPQIYFYSCHFENQYNACELKAGYVNDVPPLVNYDNCFFQSYSKFNKYDWFSGMGLYISMRWDYSITTTGTNITEIGLTPSELYSFTGCIHPHSTYCNHIKTPLTVYSIPESRTIESKPEHTYQRESQYAVTPITNGMTEYRIFYSDNPLTYDETTKKIENDVQLNSDGRFIWKISLDEENKKKNYFIHFFRRNPNTLEAQKCVVYIGEWHRPSGNQYFYMDDGDNSISGVYKWLDYDGTFPE